MSDTEVEMKVNYQYDEDGFKKETYLNGEKI